MGTEKKARKDEQYNLRKGRQPLVQDIEDDFRVTTVVPDNDSGAPGAPAKQSANKKTGGGHASIYD